MLLFQGWHGGLTRVSECHVGCHVYFVDLGLHKLLKLWADLRAKEVVQCWRFFYVRVVALTSKGHKFVKPPSMDECLSNVRCSNIERWSDIDRSMWLVKPPGLDKCCPMSSHLRWIEDRRVEGALKTCVTFCLFFTIGEWIEDRHYILSFFLPLEGALKK